MSVRTETQRAWNLERFTSPRSIGILGILLGVLAFWTALPPLHSQTPVAPVVIGIFAIAAGIYSVTRGAGRVGWGAVASGLLGIVLGLVATQSGETNLGLVVVWPALIGATLRYATPIAFAAIGGMFSERSGVVNIGLEGMMLMGAFFAVWGADKTGSWALGLVIAMGAGVLLALVHAIFTIHLRADQIVVGTGVNFLALGITGYLFVDIYGAEGTPTDIPQIWSPHLGFLERIPDVSIGSVEFGGTFLNEIFGDLSLLIWLSFALLILSYIVMFKTPVGLRIRAVGEHPRAADTVGISVYLVRYGAVLVSGALAALGGAYLSLEEVGLFDQNMTGGRGFIAIAALIFGNWRPFGAYAACLLFGFSSALGDRLPQYFEQGSSTPLLFNVLPYVLTLIAVAGVIGRSVPPAAIGRPYTKQ
jgi:general nucleoside transport system permease protein